MTTYDAPAERAETALNAVSEYARIPGADAIALAMDDLTHLAQIRKPEAAAMSTSDGLGAYDEGRLAIVGDKVRLPGDPGDNLYNWLSLEEIAEREKQWNALAKIADDAKSPADVAEVVYEALEAIGKTTF